MGAILPISPSNPPLPVLTTLIEHGADVNTATKAGETALQEFAKIGNISAVIQLLECGADVNTKTEAGETALHWAADYGDARVVRLLLKYNADVNARTKGGETPLRWAARSKHGMVMQLLCEHGAEVIEEGSDTKSVAAKVERPLANVTIWGVLIGINSYPEGKAQKLDADGRERVHYTSLRGCVNDVLLAEWYLSDFVGVPPSRIIKLVTEPQVDELNTPTYSNIIKALNSTTDAAAPGDSVYIHYSGHGGRVATAFPLLKGVGRLDKVLIPMDIKSGGQYLRDLELEYLLRKMVDKGLLVTVVLDCEYPLRRGAAGPRNVSSDQDFVSDDVPAFFDQINEWSRREARQNKGKSSLLEPKGYTLFATSHSTELHQEEGKVYGTLTYHLLNLLHHGSMADASCRTIYRRLHAEMSKIGGMATPICVGEVDRMFHGSNVPMTSPTMELR
jgi:hypothetical protein